jgi:Helix-turn-helix domain
MSLKDITDHTNPIARPERRAYRIAEFCERFGLSRETAYSLMRSGKVTYVMICGRRLILAESAEALLQTGDGSTSRRGKRLNQRAGAAA